MKKIVALILALSMVLALCACGEQKQDDKSDAVKNVERLIDGIGEVSLDKGKYIEDAETAYEQLYEVDKSSVSNYETLLSARNEYDELTSKMMKIISEQIEKAKVLAAELKIDEALAVLDAAEAEAKTDEAIALLIDAKQEISSMLYEGTDFIKIEYVLPLYAKATTITSIQFIDGWWQYKSNDMVSAYLIYENQYLCLFTEKEVVKDSNGYVDYTLFKTEDGQVLIEKLDGLDYIYITAHK